MLGRHHFEYVWYGERWEAVGDALVAVAPAWAAAAYDRAADQYQAYDEAWRAHLPASRWDADGGAYLEPLARKQAALPVAEAAAPATWLEALCAGDTEAALTRFAAARGQADGLPTSALDAARALLAACAARLGRSLPDV